MFQHLHLSGYQVLSIYSTNFFICKIFIMVNLWKTLLTAFILFMFELKCNLQKIFDNHHLSRFSILFRNIYCTDIIFNIDHVFVYIFISSNMVVPHDLCFVCLSFLHI